MNIAEAIRQALRGRDPEDLLCYETDPIYTEEVGDRRWWIDTFNVTNLDGVLVGWFGCKATGDASPGDVGWKFDASDICEVEAYEVTETRYRPKKVNQPEGETQP